MTGFEPHFNGIDEAIRWILELIIVLKNIFRLAFLIFFFHEGKDHGNVQIRIYPCRQYGWCY